ncbi:MAG: pilus assembly protein PilP [Nitrospinae bacterium]|nr:pilus assembly protein PilP [Nitrospinota bacterium]MBL7019538.1 pilus assembly protein PilP [Nitrospinaceae bacterium]
MTPPAQEDLRNHNLNTLLKLTGLKDILGNIESIVQISGDIDKGALAPGQDEFARGIMRKAYSPGKFHGTLKRSFIEDYKPQYVQSVVQWYRSALGKKILRLENEAIDSANRLALELFVKKLLDSPPSEARIRLVEKIERSAYETEAGKALFLGYVKLMHPFNENFEGKKISKALRILKGTITEPMREVVLRARLFSYRNLEDKDLREYARFLNSQAGRWFSQTVLEGFKKGIRQVLYKGELIRVELVREIDAGGPEYPLLRNMVPPGQRYLLIGKRDPFRPLVNDQGLIDFSKRDQRRLEPRLFGGELKNIAPIALAVFTKIKTQYPKLYKKLKYFEVLFNNQEALEDLEDDEYARIVEDYRDVLERSSNIKMDESPLQVEYDSLRMTGIIQKKSQAVAMIEIETTGYAVKKGDLIGPSFGYVKEILSDQVIVIEKFRDYLGRILTNQKIIQFYQSTSSEGNTNS